MNDLAPSPISHRQVSKMSSGAPIVGIVPTTIDETFRLAQLIHSSGLAPKQLTTPEAVTVVLLKGLEIGAPPMMALETIGVINGKACLFGDGIPALLWSHGFKLREWYEGEGDALVAKCLITRPDGTEVPGEYSVADAKENKLWDTREKVRRKSKAGDWYDADNDAPWFRYRKRMLKMRARGWCARDGASEVLKGMPIYEEQRDIEDARRQEPRDITPKPADLEIPDLTPAPDREQQEAKPVNSVLDVPDEEPAGAPDLDELTFLAKLRDERDLCDSIDELDEVREANADIIERLSEANRAKAIAILDGDE